MRFRKPELIPLLFIIAATILLFGLGAWQLYRLEWKNALIAQIAQAEAEPPLTALPEEKLEALEFRRAALSGRFLHDKSFLFLGRYYRSQVGTQLLTPFVLEDGRVLLVNRGWLPAHRADTPLPEYEKPEDMVTVSGQLRQGRQHKFLAPENDPAKGVWFWEDIGQLSQAAGVELLPLVLVATGEPRKGVLPVPGSAELHIRNDHLGYAITWFSVGIAGLVMFALYHREKPGAKA